MCRHTPSSPIAMLASRGPLTYWARRQEPLEVVHRERTLTGSEAPAGKRKTSWFHRVTHTLPEVSTLPSDKGAARLDAVQEKHGCWWRRDV